MKREATEPYTAAALEGYERTVAEQNRAASLTMWSGLGAILCLLLSCCLGSFRLFSGNLKLSVAIMGVLLIASIILFFVPSKKDERWFIVCSLLNYAGIGLAAQILMNALGLQIRLANLALSGLPAAAILFGVVMFYLGGDENSRAKLLYWGAAALIVIVVAAAIKYFDESSEFWLSTAICALLSCTGLAALIWANAAPEERSIFKGLAVVSFSVYLLLLAAAIVALIVMASGSNSSSNRNKSRSKKSDSDSGGFFGSRGILSSVIGERSTRSVTRTRSHYYFPGYLWYYTPYTRYASIDRMQGMSEAEREAARQRYRRRRTLVLAVVAVIVVAVIVLAMLAGRG